MSNDNGKPLAIVIAAVITAVIGPIVVWYVITSQQARSQEQILQATVSALQTQVSTRVGEQPPIQQATPRPSLTLVRVESAPAPSPRNFQITLTNGEIAVGQCWEFITQGNHYAGGIAFLVRGPGQFDFTVSDGWFAIYKNATYDDGESLLRGQIDTFRNTPTIVRLP